MIGVIGCRAYPATRASKAASTSIFSFCMGVRRATRIVLEQTRDGRKAVATYGPLIHNPQVIDMLEDLMREKDIIYIISKGQPLPG